MTGENDRDYNWRKLSRLLRLATGGGLTFNSDGELHTSPSLVGTAAEADANTLAIAAETRARASGDAALDERIRGLSDTGLTAMQRAEVAEEILEAVDTVQVRPNYWSTENQDARDFTVFVHSFGVPAEATNISLGIHGVLAGRQTYSRATESYTFNIGAADVGTIARAIANGAEETVQATVLFQDRSSGAVTLLTRHFLLRVVAETPDDASAVAADLTTEIAARLAGDNALGARVTTLENAPSRGADLPRIEFGTLDVRMAQSDVETALNASRYKGYLSGSRAWFPRVWDHTGLANQNWVLWISGSTVAPVGVENASGRSWLATDRTAISAATALTRGGVAGRYWLLRTDRQPNRYQDVTLLTSGW